jgi:site-specific DNA-methyltransferase (adenine-specific)
MLETNKIYLGNHLEILASCNSNYIDLTVTSPPYDTLRDYDGYTFSYESLLTTLYRVTKDGGVVVWVVGDQTYKFCESLTSFKQALYAVDVGFKLLDTMAFVKQNYAPAYPTMRRYAQVFEYMFVFVKGYKPKTFNPVRIPVAERTKKRKKNMVGLNIGKKMVHIQSLKR